MATRKERLMSWLFDGSLSGALVFVLGFMLVAAVFCVMVAAAVSAIRGTL